MLPVALASALRSANRSSAAALSSVLARRFAIIASQSPSVFGSTTEALRARRSNATFASAPPHQWAAAPAKRAWSIEELARLEESVNQQPDNAAVQVMFYKILNENGHHQIVSDRIKSGRFALNNEVVSELLVATEAIRNSSRHGFVAAAAAASAASASAGLGANARPAWWPQRLPFPAWLARVVGPSADAASTAPPPTVVGTESNPLVVRNLPMKQSALKHFMAFVSLGVSVAFMYYLYLQISGKGGILGGADKFKPTINLSTRFSDVQGVTEAKNELVEVVEFLKDPSKFNKLGGKLPRGVLLTGPPGTGKTLLAKAVAGEAGVPFFYASGSEFEEMYVGVGAKRVRELFAAAKAHAPCIIFIDEIDAIGGARNAKDHQAMRMTMNQLLTELDGFNGSSDIIVMGATNFPSILDKALLRPGRFDRHVVVDLPDQAGRKAMFDLHISKNRVPITADVNTQLLARGTPGSSGADLANIVNLAAVRASIAGRAAVTHADFEHAKDRALMGAERQSMTMTDGEKRLTAFHEGGHALVALKTAGAQPVHKATILPRGQALGFVLQLPERDQYSINRTQLLAKLDVAMGGRIAEELMFGPDNVTTGATSDMQQATRMATDMVLRYGMCEESIGLVYRSAEDYGSLSEQAKLAVDAEVRRLIDQSYARTRRLLDSNRAQLTSIADALMSYETLTGAELVQLMRGDPLTHRIAGTSGAAAEEMYNAPPASGTSASRSGGAVVPVPAHHSEQKDGGAQGGAAR